MEESSSEGLHLDGIGSHQQRSHQLRRELNFHRFLAISTRFPSGQRQLKEISWGPLTCYGRWLTQLGRHSSPMGRVDLQSGKLHGTLQPARIKVISSNGAPPGGSVRASSQVLSYIGEGILQASAPGSQRLLSLAQGRRRPSSPCRRRSGSQCTTPRAAPRRPAPAAFRASPPARRGGGRPCAAAAPRRGCR